MSIDLLNKNQNENLIKIINNPVKWKNYTNKLRLNCKNLNRSFQENDKRSKSSINIEKEKNYNFFNKNYEQMLINKNLKINEDNQNHIDDNYYQMQNDINQCVNNLEYQSKIANKTKSSKNIYKKSLSNLTEQFPLLKQGHDDLIQIFRNQNIKIVEFENQNIKLVAENTVLYENNLKLENQNKQLNELLVDYKRTKLENQISELKDKNKINNETIIKLKNENEKLINKLKNSYANQEVINNKYKELKDVQKTNMDKFEKMYRTIKGKEQIKNKVNDAVKKISLNNSQSNKKIKSLSPNKNLDFKNSIKSDKNDNEKLKIKKLNSSYFNDSNTKNLSVKDNDINLINSNNDCLNN